MNNKLKKWVAMIGLMALCLLAIGGTVGAAATELSPRATSGARLGTQQDNSTSKPNDPGNSAVVDGGFLSAAKAWAKDHGVGLLYGLGVGLVVGAAVAGVAVLLVASAPVWVIVGAGALAGGLYGLITGAIKFDLWDCVLFSAIGAVSAGVGTGLAAGWLARAAVDVVGGGLAMVGSYLLHDPHPTWGGAGQAFVIGAVTAGVFVGLGAAANKLFGPALGRLGGKVRNLLPWGRGAGAAVGEGAAGSSPALTEAVGPGVQREITAGGAAVTETNPAVIARTVETMAPKFSRGYLQSLRSFQDDMAEALSEAGLTRSEFDHLRVTPTDQLTDAEIVAMMQIRDAVPAPTTDTLLQRVIRPEDVDRYFKGDYNEIYGFVSRAEDVKVFATPGEVKNGLRLDYKGNPFSDDEAMYLIRFKAAEPTRIHTAYGGNTADAAARVGGKTGLEPTQWVEQDFPFTGHGFTSDTHHVVPEYHTEGAVRAQDGAELIQLTPNGEEHLIGVYSEVKRMWLEVGKGWK